MGLLICILNGLFWAFFDITRKLSLKYLHPKILLSFFMIVQVIIFFVWTLYEKNFYFSYNYVLPGIILIFISVISAIFFLKSILHSDLSLTIPLLSLTPIFSSLFSLLFLNEKLLLTQYFGILSIVLGTLTLYTKELTLNSFFRSFMIIKENKGAKLMVIVSIFWSVTPVIDKICLKYTPINYHGLIQSLGMLLAIITISVKEIKTLNFPLKSTGLIIITLLIGTTATILQFYSILENYVPIMESIKRTIGQVCALIFGYIIFKERITIQKVVGVLILSIGIFYIF